MWELLLIFLGNAYWLLFILIGLLYLIGVVMMAKDESPKTKGRRR